MSTIGYTNGADWSAATQSWTILFDTTKAIYVGPTRDAPDLGYDSDSIFYYPLALDFASVVFPKANSELLAYDDGGFYYNMGDRTSVVLAIGGTFGDLIETGSAADVINGGTGNDTLAGGGGADEYRFSGPGSGDDFINGFVHGTDSIWLDKAYGFSASQIVARITYGGGNAVIDLDNGDSITLNGVAGGLDASDFLVDNFAPTAAITAPSYNATEQVNLSLKGQLAIDDVDATGDVTVTLSVAFGILTVTAGTSGASVGGSNTGTVTITGTIAEISALLNTDGNSTVLLNANADVPLASTTLTLSIQDDGISGVGKLTASDTATISIAAVNDAPTLALTPSKTSLKEIADTSTAIKVADITVSDVDGGTNVLSLAGADKGLFVIKNGDLYLKAGAKLDFETNPKLDVLVRVDDATIGSEPEASVSFSLQITDVREAISGNNSANTLSGASGADLIDGKGGGDTLSGGGGADVIIGGAGADTMSGGAGPDVFRFKPGDLPSVNIFDRFLSPMNGKYDLITDFKPGTDVIDLKALDADSKTGGNQKFHLEGEGGLSASRGELVYQLYGTQAAARHTIIFGDTDGDGAYDFRIVLKGHHHLDADDFIL